MRLDCKIWTGCLDKDGYGLRKMPWRKAPVRVHRLAYCENLGIPLAAINGKLVLHACDTPPCFNADHLFLGTDIDNIFDKISKNRHSHGDTHGRRKLNESQVVEILLLSGKESSAEVAARYGMSRRQIRDIFNRRYWAHVRVPTGDSR
jgi:hypothetical protein